MTETVPCKGATTWIISFLDSAHYEMNAAETVATSHLIQDYSHPPKLFMLSHSSPPPLSHSGLLFFLLFFFSSFNERYRGGVVGPRRKTRGLMWSALLTFPY